MIKQEWYDRKLVQAAPVTLIPRASIKTCLGLFLISHKKEQERSRIRAGGGDRVRWMKNGVGGILGISVFYGVDLEIGEGGALRESLITGGMGAMWYVTCDMWHLTHDRNGKVNLLSKCQLFCSYGLGMKVCWRYFHKPSLSELINHWQRWL